MARLLMLLMSAAAGFALAGGAVLAVKFALLDEVYHPGAPLQRPVASVDEANSAPYIPEEFTEEVEAEQRDRAPADNVAEREATRPANKRVLAISSEPLVLNEPEESEPGDNDSKAGADQEDEIAENSVDRRHSAGSVPDETAVAARSTQVNRASRPARRARAKSRRNDLRKPRRARRRGRFGFLSVEARPRATVFVDGKRVGVTPLRVRVPSGKRRIKAVTVEGDEVRRTVHFSPGETERLRLSSR